MLQGENAIERYKNSRRVAPADDAELVDPFNQILYQMDGCTLALGWLGYLRESYHGEPYATMYLLKEAWYNKDQICHISGGELKSRLPRAKELAAIRIKRCNYDPKHLPQILKSYDDFVELFLQKEKAGLNPYVDVSY